MDIRDILDQSRTLSDQHYENKLRLLQHLSEILCTEQNTLSAKELLTSFLNREKLGATIVADGIALPHIKSEHVEKPIAALVSLDEQVEYDPTDKATVDLIFALVVPDSDDANANHLLTKISSLISQPQFAEQLRSAKDNHLLHELITLEPPHQPD